MDDTLLILIGAYATCAFVVALGALSSYMRWRVYGSRHLGKTITRLPELPVRLPLGKSMLAGLALATVLAVAAVIWLIVANWFQAEVPGCAGPIALALATLGSIAGMWGWTLYTYWRAETASIEIKLPSVWWPSITSVIFGYFSAAMYVGAFQGNAC